MLISPRVLVLYYSSYGHVETLAQAVRDGAREAGAQEAVPGSTHDAQPHRHAGRRQVVRLRQAAAVEQRQAVAGEQFNGHRSS